MKKVHSIVKNIQKHRQTDPTKVPHVYNLLRPGMKNFQEFKFLSSSLTWESACRSPDRGAVLDTCKDKRKKKILKSDWSLEILKYLRNKPNFAQSMRR